MICLVYFMPSIVQGTHKIIVELRIALKITKPSLLVFQRRRAESGKIQKVPHVASPKSALPKKYSENLGFPMFRL